MRESFRNKSLQTLGISAVALAPVTADAAIVHVSGSPIVIGLTSGGTWDIDGIGADEFDFRNQHNTAYVGGRTFVDHSVRLISGDPLNGRGLAATSPSGSLVAALVGSEYVGSGQSPSAPP